MLRRLALIAALAATPALAQTVPVTPTTQDYLKQAGNFFRNCDARADENGTRPDPNFVCLAFLAGLIEGYNTAAVANGNRQPYCLPRPTSLAELTDMMVTVIERGAPETLPTAAVFHFIVEANFTCPDAPADPEPAAGEGSDDTKAQ